MVINFNGSLVKKSLILDLANLDVWIRAAFVLLCVELVNQLASRRGRVGNIRPANK